MRHSALVWGRRALTIVAGVLVGASIALVVVVATGTATVVTTSGTSMQPGFHSGDLVLVRTAPGYEVGDVVAYRSRTLHATVLHRIVDRSHGRFTFKGDNNAWLDQDRPTEADLVGSEWFHVSGAGRLLTFFQRPSSALALSMFVGLVLTGSVGTTVQSELRRRRPGRSRRRTSGPTVGPAIGPTGGPTVGPIEPPAPGTPLTDGSPGRVVRARSRARAEAQAAAERAAAARAGAARTRRARRTVAGSRPRRRPGRADRVALAVAALVGSAGLLLGSWAVLHPTTTVVTDRLRYQVRDELTYSATVPATPVYDSTTVATGSPVFLQLTDAVRLHVRGRVRAPGLRDASVTLGVAAVLSDHGGWTRRIDLAPPTSTPGPDGRADVDLSLGDVRRLLAEVEATTGVRNSGWGLTIVVTSAAHGRLGGEPLADEREQRYEFLLDGRQFRPVTKVADGPRPAMVDRHDGTVARRRTRQVTLSVPGVDLSTGSARSAAAALLGVAALLGMGAFVHARLRGPRTEADQILARHGRRVVPVDQPPDPEGEATVDVARMSSLARMANHHDRLILHHREDETDTFLVDIGHTVYRYRARRVGWTYRDVDGPAGDAADAGR